MIEDVEQEVKLEIIKLFKGGNKINEISDILRVPDVSVSRVLNENKDLITAVKDEARALRGDYEGDGDDRIKTIKTISKLHEQTLQIVEQAKNDGRPELALAAMKEAREQTALIMKNKGELNPDAKKDDLIPPDFLTFLFDKIKEQTKDGDKNNESKVDEPDNVQM